MFQVDYLIPVTKHQPIQHDNVIMKNMLLHYSFLLFYLLPRLWITFSDPFVNHAIKTMLCYTVRDVWLIMNFLQKKQFELALTQLYHQPSRLVYLCWYLIRRAYCKRTVSSYEDVCNFWIISRVWNSDGSEVLSFYWNHFLNSNILIHLLENCSYLVAV